MNKLMGALQSRAMWLGLLTILSANIPAVNAWIQAHFTGQVAVTIGGLLGMVIRYFTTQSLEAKGTSSA